MQTWNPDCGKKTKFIYHPRARRTDAEPVMHKVNSLVIIGSFFQYMMRTCPTRGNKKPLVGAGNFTRPFWTGGFWENQAAGSFCLSKRFIVRMAATRRMPPCAWYSIDRSILTYQKKSLAPAQGQQGFLLCTIQCSYCAFRAVIMPSWPFSVCWAFLLPSENLPDFKN